MTIRTYRGTITFATWAACGFGLGFAPVAPGTIATIVLALIYCCLPPTVGPVWIAIAVLVLAAVGVPLCTAAEKQLGHDAGSIVWDEFAGFALTVCFLPRTPEVVVAAVLLFRFFDIIKLFPAGRAQGVKGGWGVMLDDLIAGMYANLVIRAGLALLA